MSKKTLTTLLRELNSCNDAVEFIKGKTIEQAVSEVKRGDWLLWLASKLNCDHRLLTLAKGKCAETVIHLMKDERSVNAVNSAIKYGEGMATLEELKAAANAAKAAYAADAAKAAYAADAAYAAYAAYADAAYASYAASYAAAKLKNQRQTADICRELLGEFIIKEVNKSINHE